jgi:hypothetical protein
MRTKQRWITLALGTLVALGSYGYADDSKVINGGACYSRFTVLAGETTPPRLNRFSTIINLDGRQVQVACPMVRDRLLGGGTVASGAAASVTVRLNGRGTNVSCTLQSLDGFGQLVDSDTRSGGATQDTNLVLQVDQSANSGFYALQCNLPDGGVIYSYRLVEPTPTDTD